MRNILFLLLTMLPLASWGTDYDGGRYEGTTADGGYCRIYINRPEVPGWGARPILLVRELVAGYSTVDGPYVKKGTPIFLPFATGEFPDLKQVLHAIATRSTDVLQQTFVRKDADNNEQTASTTLSFEYKADGDLAALHINSIQGVSRQIDCITLSHLSDPPPQLQK